jgi:hypothetical protein
MHCSKCSENSSCCGERLAGHLDLGECKNLACAINAMEIVESFQKNIDAEGKEGD